MAAWLEAKRTRKQPTAKASAGLKERPFPMIIFAQNERRPPGDRTGVASDSRRQELNPPVGIISGSLPHLVRTRRR